MIDFYVQFCVTMFACLLACLGGEWRLVLYAIPVAHVLSFLIRLLLPYRKTRFFHVYGWYLVAFLITYLFEISGWFEFFGVLSVFFGIGFIVNCYKDFSTYEAPVEQIVDES